MLRHGRDRGVVKNQSARQHDAQCLAHAVSELNRRKRVKSSRREGVDAVHRLSQHLGHNSPNRDLDLSWGRCCHATALRFCTSHASVSRERSKDAFPRRCSQQLSNEVPGPFGSVEPRKCGRVKARIHQRGRRTCRGNGLGHLAGLQRAQPDRSKHVSVRRSHSCAAKRAQLQADRRQAGLLPRDGGHVEHCIGGGVVRCTCLAPHSRCRA